MLTSTEIVAMREVQEEVFLDECVRQAPTETRGATGEVLRSYADDETLSCRFLPAPGRERATSEAIWANAEALVRLPVDTAVAVEDRIRITKRHGESVTALTFEVSGLPERGPTALTVPLRRVTL